MEVMQLQPLGVASTQQPQVMLGGTSLTGEEDMPRTWMSPLAVLLNFHPAAFRQVPAQQGWAGRAGVQGKVSSPLVPSCRQTRSRGKHMAGNPVPDGNLLPLLQPPVGRCSSRTHSARRGGCIPAGTAPKPPLGGWAGWHGWMASCSHAGAPRGAQGATWAHTELPERTSPCLAGQGLKLGLGGQNRANELMAIN